MKLSNLSSFCFLQIQIRDYICIFIGRILRFYLHAEKQSRYSFFKVFLASFSRRKYKNVYSSEELVWSSTDSGSVMPSRTVERGSLGTTFRYFTKGSGHRCSAVSPRLNSVAPTKSHLFL